MATEPAIKVDGLNRLDRQLKQAGDAVSDGTRSELKDINFAAAEAIKVEALHRAPVRSGRLRSSIRAAATARQGNVKVGFASVPYAAVIHFGWAEHNIEPQPFLYDAVDSRRDAVEREYEQRIHALMERTFPDGLR